MCVNKADGWGSDLLQMGLLSWSRDCTGNPRATSWAQSSYEVIGQILLHGVTVMLHWLIRETEGKGEKTDVSGEL